MYVALDKSVCNIDICESTFKEMLCVLESENCSFFCVCVCVYVRIVENGQERVEVEEDGEMKSLTINGKEQMLRLNNK